MEPTEYPNQTEEALMDQMSYTQMKTSKLVPNMYSERRSLRIKSAVVRV